MQRKRTISGRKGERGVVILLVAIVLLFVVGAMAALSIDLVTFYTARSEAQLAADGAALAGARVLANSGMTSNPTDLALRGNAETLARTIATQVASNNQVGGRNLSSGGACAAGLEISVCFNDGDASFGTNPHVTVQVTRADLPTFFARIWGRATVTVSSSATAEAYNPSGADFAGGTTTPIAPACVKPWLLPNIDPSPTATSPYRIFDPADGDIVNTGLLGYEANIPLTRLRTACDTNCGPVPPPPPPPPRPTLAYYPGDPATSFPPPSASSVACSGSAGFTAYQLSVAGCVQTPIACNQTVNIDTTSYLARDTETGAAVNCLAHSAAGEGDNVDAAAPSPPFQFVAGADNPVVQAGTLAAGTDVFVSSSLVTVPVFDSSTWPPVTYPNVQVVGFVQLFLEPAGNAVPANGRIRTKVVNLAGCGTTATGQAILGNGASAVPVRLIAP